MRGQGRTYGVLSLAVAVVALCASPASATVLTAAGDGVITLTGDGIGSGVSKVAVSHSLPGGGTDSGQLVFLAMGGPPIEAPEGLTLADGSASFCATSSGAIVCDNDEVDSITAGLGDNNDFLLVQPLTRIGDHAPSDPAGDPAIDADLGSGNDTFIGSLLAETVHDGPGTDMVQGIAPGGGGHDVIVQPDVANPALEDAGDVLDTDYMAGVVDYSARTSGGVNVTTRNGAADDGAPGENDQVLAQGVRGTGSADTLMAGITNEEFIAYTLAGGGGNDVMTGGAGADKLDGGGGNDEITGDIGADQIAGGAGDDVIRENDGDPESALACGIGVDTVQADPVEVDVVEPAGAGDAGCESVNRTALPPLDTTIITELPAFTNDATPTVEFSASEPRAWFECSLDGGEYFGCGSPLTSPTPLDDGPHELLVRSVWGTRKDPTPAKVTTVVDTTVPDTAVLQPALPEDDVLAKTWSSGEAGVKFQCRIDGGAWTDCTDSLPVIGVAVGGHALEVRAVDAASNTDATPAATTFTVPAKPTVSISPDPATGHRLQDVTFTATASPATAGGPAPTLAWDVDGDGFDDGSGTMLTTQYAELGTKAVRVRATDAGGGMATAERTITIVNRAPTCVGKSAETGFETAVEVELACTDADGDPVTMAIGDGPAHGALGAVVGTKLTYTPAAGFSGADSFSYRASDGTATSAPATVSLTVKPKVAEPGTGGGGTGGGPTGGGTGSGSTNPPPDTKPPAATLATTKQRLAKLVGKGFTVTVKLDEAGTIKVMITVNPATARKLKLDRKAKKPVVIGTLTRSAGAGNVNMVVKLTAKARKALKKAKAVKVAIAVEVKDAAGNATKRTGTQTLKR